MEIIMQKRGYIAGPMRGYPLLNFPAFDRAAALGRDLGHGIISPAEIDRESGVTETDTEFGPAMVREFVRRDIGALLDLRAENGDFIALLPGWWQSTGARGEYFVAKWLGLEILDAESFQPLDVSLIGSPLQIVVPRLDGDVCRTGTCVWKED